MVRIVLCSIFVLAVPILIVKFAFYNLFMKLFAGATVIPDAMEIIFQKAIALGISGAVSNLYFYYCCCFYLVLKPENVLVKFLKFEIELYVVI